MPRRYQHRPVPEFPRSGFLGPQALPDDSSATELNITVEHPTEFGRWTNIPSLVPGQIGTEAILAGGPMTDEQQQRALDFASFLLAHGVQLPSFGTVEDAVTGAEHRHKQFER
jgi:hypothetical protein